MNMQTTNGWTYATTADTAKLIRKDLKAAWPGVKFQVLTGRGAGVSAVDVNWTDGPTEKQVKAIVGKYEAGSFNGMIDLYEYDADRYTVDGVDVTVRYVMCQRDMSNAADEALYRLVREYRNMEEAPLYEVGTFVRREFVEWDGSTTPIPQTTAELPSHIEYVEWNKAYEAEIAAGKEKEPVIVTPPFESYEIRRARAGRGSNNFREANSSNNWKVW